MSTKSTIAYAEDFHLYQEIFEDESIYIQVEDCGFLNYNGGENGSLVFRLSVEQMDRIVDAWKAQREKVSTHQDDLSVKTPAALPLKFVDG